MAEFPTLGIRVENGQAVRAIEGLNAAFDKTTKKIEESRVKFDAWQQTTAQSVAPVNTLRASSENLAKAKDAATLSAGRLRGGLTSLASSVIGLNPQVSQLTSVLGSFALGSGVMIGVLAGVAALGFAYNKLTEDSRKFKEQTDKLIESLIKQKQAAYDATLAGIQAQGGTALGAELKAQSALQAFDASGFSPAFLGVRKRLVAELAAASTAVEQTRQNEITKRADMEKDAADAQKRHLAELAALAKRSAADAERYLDALIQKANTAANAFSQMGYGAFSFGEGLDLKPINIPTSVSRAGQGSGAFVNLGGIGGLTGSSFAVPGGLGQVGPQTYQGRQQAEHLNFILMGGLVMPVKHVGQEVNKVAESLKFASQSITSTATNFVIGKTAGGGIAGNLLGGIGGGVGTAAASLFPAHTFAGGAIGQAVVGPIFGSILGAFGSAVGAGVDAMFDFSGSIKAARIALEGMRRAVESNIASFEARAAGTEGSLAEQIRRVMDEAAQLRADILASFRAGGASQFFQGRGDEALAKRDAELARIDAAEKAYIARIKEADAIKATTEALNAFTTSVRNAPSGFKVESYINRFAAARPWDYNGGPMSMPFSPQGGPTSTGGLSLSMSGVTFKIEGNTGEALLKDLVNELRKKASVTVGGNAPLADALEYA